MTNIVLNVFGFISLFRETCEKSVRATDAHKSFMQISSVVWITTISAHTQQIAEVVEYKREQRKKNENKY